MSYDTRHMPSITYHKSNVHKNVMSYVKSHQSFVTYHMSWTVCPVRKCSITHVTCLKTKCQMSRVAVAHDEEEGLREAPSTDTLVDVRCHVFSSSCRCHHRPLAVDVSLEHVRPAPVTDSWTH